MAPIEVLPVDREFYQRELAATLPERLIDIHTHIWTAGMSSDRSAAHRVVSWPGRVAQVHPVEDLLATYAALFPGHSVTPMVFASIAAQQNMDAANSYVAQSARAHGLPALLLAHPTWTGDDLARRLEADDFLGVKVYLSYAPSYLPPDEIRVFDFLPPHQLDVLDSLGKIVMLHLPRSGRLKDPVNLAQMVQIEQRWPNVRLIVAHVGRAYCPEDVGNAFEVLAPTRQVCFDISANTNQQVFEQLIRAVGPQRILFGSDLPILRMRAGRVCENGIYVNIVPRGLYGDLTGDKNMRAVDGPEAARLTFLLYEEIAAFLRAAQACGLSSADLAAVFTGNAERLLQLSRRQT